MLEIPLPDHPTTLADWLAHCERLHPKSIDMGLERVQRVAQRMGLVMSCPVITVAGTNGKGSTCAMLEAIYSESGYRTGVYTSPHLVHFEERCRIAGVPVEAATLLPALAEVEQARAGQGDDEPVSLTYFEFTTLAILQTLARSGLDVVILEVGLGGRLDAVNIIDTDCAVITCIALDHMAMLGNDREAIGYEKAGIMRTGRPVVVSDPVPPQSVIDRATEVGADLWRVGKDFHFAGDQQQWGWAMHPSHGGRRYSGLAYPALRGSNQLVNAAGVLAAVEALRARLPVTAQAVRNGLVLVDLPGRFQIVPGTPTLVLDVAHNPHSVAALTENLDAMGYYPTTHAVFGAMADKDLSAMIERIAPLIDHWHLTELPLDRAIKTDALRQKLDAHPATAPGGKSRVAGCHADPMSALRAAVSLADPADRIVVFGSFFTVGGVLQQGVPRLSARHLTA
ncbi:bifunctional tetrahydrofolate synthase/dihydrofolate synthase [Hydrogenophaga sp.]|uniref:bifunctional tetrahydrofolate synthase/dihydrofolate synthase n=1 Tax=Hydrogenophaga sp. TaxID=1904254 RepID=UPI00271617C6|nr:bifunctional tetrahydrofolate synthase/dihydrofolate synthase [Hydrogenophaga sp.]MDO8902948.1 bifunctional tetrahydrofolate synthase/dihydrofolate synthase [Hydrogenophaga sp.]